MTRGRREAEPERTETYPEASANFTSLLISGEYNADALKQALRAVSDLIGIGVVINDHTTLALRHNAVSIYASQAAALAKLHNDGEASVQFLKVSENLASIASVLDPKLPTPSGSNEDKPLSASKTSGAKTP